MSGNYKVPSMKEIEAIPWNGYNVVSTFSGGGGSCLGYRMAGYRVLYANEFIEEARNTYKANHPNSYLDGRDIRAVTGDDILNIIGMKKGEIDLFDGSPPCSAFSTAGSRDHGWGKVKNYSDSRQRVDDLFFEYTRILRDLQPKVFVAENVSGLVKGKAKGYFKLILAEMKSCGYEVSARLLNAKYLGVPQSRERLIFVGVRNDLVEKFGVHPVHPKPLKNIFTIKDAIDDVCNDPKEVEYLTTIIDKYSIGNLVHKMPKNPRKTVSGEDIRGKGYFQLTRNPYNVPASTICQSHGGGGIAGAIHPLYDRKYTINELKRLTSVPDDFVLTGEFAQQWERLGRMVPPVMMMHIAKTIEKEILCKISENA